MGINIEITGEIRIKEELKKFNKFGKDAGDILDKIIKKHDLKSLIKLR